MSVTLDLRRLKLSPTERMQEDLLAAKTPYRKLIVAAEYGNIELARELLAQGASIDPKEPDTYGTTPLYVAVVNRKLDMVKFLVTNGANVNQKAHGNGNNPPLNASILCRDFAIFSYLLKKGAMVNQENLFHQTALHEASNLAQHDIDLAEMFINKLLSLGADVTAKCNGHTPQEEAIMFINMETKLTKEEKLHRIERVNQCFASIKVIEPPIKIAGLLKYSVVCAENSASTKSEEDYVVVKKETALEGYTEQTQQSKCSMM